MVFITETTYSVTLSIVTIAASEINIMPSTNERVNKCIM